MSIGSQLEGQSAATPICENAVTCTAPASAAPIPAWWWAPGLAGECVSVADAARTAPAFIVDHPSRDLAGLTFAAAETAIRAGGALLVPMYRQAKLFEWSTPASLVVNYVISSNTEFRGWAHERDIPVLLLHSEGCLATDVEAAVAATIAEPAFPRLTRCLFWSDRMRDVYRQSCPAASSPRFETTGHPRYDLIVEPLRSTALPPKPTNPVVVFATRFPTLNTFGGMTPVSQILGYWRWFGSCDVERLAWLPREASTLLACLKMVRAVAQAHPSARIIIRPHPFEGYELYEAAFGDLPNVEVNGRGVSLEAIAGASVFFHFRSSTGFEARALDVRVASIVPDAAPALTEFDRTSVEVHTADEAVAFVEAAIANQAIEQPAIAPGDYDYYLGQNRGRAARLVAEAVVADASPDVRPPSLWRLPRRPWLRQWHDVLRRRWVADEREKRKVFDAADVQRWLDRWSQAYGMSRMRARNVVGRPFLDPPVMFAGAPLAVEVTRQPDGSSR